MLIVSKTPLRISFFGGGSDLPAFLDKEHGAALSATINLFNYVILNETKGPIRFIHEDVQIGLSNMRNKIVSETLNKYTIHNGMDIVSLSDVHAIGAGLGGSSAFAVGLVNGIICKSLEKVYEHPELLAQAACEIEIERCGYPIGIQDQYAAAYGGFKLYEYHKNPQRHATIIRDFWPKFSPEQFGWSSDKRKTLGEWDILRRRLTERLVLIYSGIPRMNGDAGTILQRQQETMRNDKEKFILMKRIRDRAYQGAEYLNNGYLDQFGELLHENWMDKKSLTADLSNTEFDEMYNFSRENGAIGGKLLGAGGGGFFLFYVPDTETRKALIRAIDDYFLHAKHYPFEFYPFGSTVHEL